MSDIKVLALDLDGTLTNDQKLVTPRTRAALDAAIEKGVTIVLASGRPTAGIQPLAEELGGTGGITMAAISITGIFGNILGPQVLRWFHVTDPVAQGVAMGCGSHAFGTVRALEMGEVEGAMGSLSLVITALLTVVIAPFLGNLI